MITKLAIQAIAFRLRRYLSDRRPGSRVSGLQSLASGFESEIYAFTFHPPAAATLPLILRFYPGEEAAAKIMREAGGIRRLIEAGFPVAAVYFAETDPVYLGSPFTILERLDGGALWPILNQVPPPEEERLLERFGTLCARLHRLDWRPFTERANAYSANPRLLLEETFAAQRQLCQQYDLPGCLPVVDWLENRQAQIAVQPAVVHLDLHANNVFLSPDGRLVVIDWTQIGVADYRSDLSWTVLIMGDYGRAGWRERILDGYTREAGRPVEDLDYFSVISAMKLLASTLISLKTSPSALGLRAETATAAAEQAPAILRLSRRIERISGIFIPEAAQ